MIQPAGDSLPRDGYPTESDGHLRREAAEEEGHVMVPLGIIAIVIIAILLIWLL
jgi:hypothetical protein